MGGDPKPPTRVPIQLKLRAVDCPACGFELRVKVEIAQKAGATRPSTCPRCHTALVTWVEEAHYGPATVTPIKR